MAPTILIVGATGNTGQNVVYQLPELLKARNAKYRILGTTRSVDSPTSQELSRIPGVEMVEIDWTTIDAAWLKAQGVVKAYIAPFNQPSQFVEESAFYNALLAAGVKYVVKVSTNVKYISPTSPVFYGRAHWATENLLSQPEFKALQFTSLQPNFFTASYLASSADWIESLSKTGKQDVFKLSLAENEPVAMVDPEDVGHAGAQLLALEDPSPYDGKRLVISGPEDVTGRDIVVMAEKIAGVKAEKTAFKDASFIEDLAAKGTYPQKVVSSIMAGFDCLWKGECSLAGTPTSNEVLELSPPKRTVEVALRKLLEKKGVKVPLQ